MAQAPILIKCECGVETRGRTGDVIRCTGCGLSYDTAKEGKHLEMLAGRLQRQFKYLSRAGIGVVGLSGLVGAVVFQTLGLVIGAAAGRSRAQCDQTRRWPRALRSSPSTRRTPRPPR